MRTSIWVWIVIVLLVIAGIGWWVSMPSTPAPATTTTDTTQTTDQTQQQGVQTGTTVDTTVGVTTGAPMSATVTYTSSGFSPKTVTIAKGGTVTFVNQSGSPFWVASDPHPVHTAYDGTSRTTHCAAGYTGTKPFDECAAGTSFSFTFNKTGSFGYHNHMVDENGGTVVVQ